MTATPETTSDAREQFEAILRRIAGSRLTAREIDRILHAADRYQATGRYRTNVAPCGTPAAYHRHIRRGEPVDESCRQAMRAEARTRQAAKPKIAKQTVCACGCGLPVFCKGYASGCYKRWVNAGRPASGPPPPVPQAATTAAINALQQARRATRLAEYRRLRSIGYTRDQAAARLGVCETTARAYEQQSQQADAA